VGDKVSFPNRINPLLFFAAGTVAAARSTAGRVKLMRTARQGSARKH